MFTFPDSFQGPLKLNRPILKNSAWKLQLHEKLKIKLTLHKEFRTWPNSSHPKENQLKWFILISKILIFDSHPMCALPLPFMNFCKVLFFPSLAASQLSFLLVRNTQLQKWYQMHKEYTAGFWLYNTEQKPDWWEQKGQDKRWKCLHDHHEDFQPCVSHVSETLERNWGKFRLRNTSGSLESTERDVDSV